MTDFTRDGNSIRIPIEPDESGFVGRECPEKDCEGYFKIELGTGLTGDDLLCHCPYCGRANDPSHFFTKEQISYAESIVMREISNGIFKILKKSEIRPQRNSIFSIGIEVKGTPSPIHYYREEKLEQEVICDKCTLRYSIYGVFGFCPDCGIHNSVQILSINFEVVKKLLKLAEETTDNGIAEKLIESALKEVVSALDGFGRELCRVNAPKARDSVKAENISFQKIVAAKDKLITQFGIDIKAAVTAPDWDTVIRQFQKRHLLTHTMGVIDQEYIDNTNESSALLGRKVVIDPNEIQSLIASLSRIATFLATELNKLP